MWPTGAAGGGDRVVLLAGDPVRFPEGQDVAAVLPELMKAFPQRFVVVVVPRDNEDAVARRYGSQRWPTLLFFRDGQYVTALAGMQDWDVYLKARGRRAGPAAFAPAHHRHSRGQPVGRSPWQQLPLNPPTRPGFRPMKDFPIPVVAIGPGTQTEDETLDYLPMPKDMDTYRAPMLPEPEELAGRDAARAALNQVLALLDRTAQRGPGGQVSLNGMPAADLALVNQIMGEGEASALVREPDGQLEVRVQEAVLAGVWRLMTFRLTARTALVDDVIEVGPVPALLRAIAVDDVWPAGTMPQWVGALPPSVQNAPMLLEELRDQVADWQPGKLPHVVNLTLLPVTPQDIGFLDHHLGTGRVLMLSRGYGNCRISNTRMRNCWRVVYYNSMDKVISQHRRGGGHARSGHGRPGRPARLA
jgi:hydrogenase-1 operon protein HyaF